MPPSSASVMDLVDHAAWERAGNQLQIYEPSVARFVKNMIPQLKWRLTLLASLFLCRLGKGGPEELIYYIMKN